MTSFSSSLNMPHISKTITTLGLLLLAYVALYASWLTPQPLRALHKHWTTPDDLDFGYFLLAIVIFFLSRLLLRRKNNAPNYYLLLPLLASSLLTALFFWLKIQSVVHVLIVANFVLTLGVLMGSKTMISAIKPISIIIMGLPIWYLVSPLLQQLTVIAVSSTLMTLDIQATIEGNYITIPTGIIHVAKGCSGLKYFLSAIALALIANNLIERRLLQQLVLIATAAILACFANWVRVFVLVLVGYYEGIDHPLMADHDDLGWVIFIICALLPYFLIQKYGRIEPAKIVASNNARNHTNNKVIAFLIIFFVLTTPFFLYSLHQNRQITVQAASLELPKKFEQWQRVPDFGRSWYPDFPQATTTQHASYIKDNKKLNMSALIYSGDYTEEEIISSENHFFSNDRWRLVSRDKLNLDGKHWIISLLASLNAETTFRVVLHAYVVGDQQTSSSLRTKINRLLNPGELTYVLAISTDCEQSGCVRELPAANDFAQILSRHVATAH